MIIVCEQCGKQGTLEEGSYRGKKLRLKCPYCTRAFVFAVPANGNGASALVEEAIVAPKGLPAASSEQVDAFVNEAKRIARLIISEIKLYNQDRIAKATSKKEILDLLRNDLIKGKQHYNSRIASKLPAGPDYFTDTVKEILLTGKH
jgi:hypothetical protein